MLIFETASAMQAWCQEQKKAGRTIGLVPTMGYLHQGHLSLVQEARRQCDRVVVSIFVNPIQFGAGEDLDKYPRDLSGDCKLLEENQADAVFAPSVRDMYPAGYSTFVEMAGTVTNRLCGASRPGHFRGVTTVVSKLFNICVPDKAFFGQKDAQQVLVIEKMVRELNFPLQIVRVPIKREADGLAMSSRNVYLSSEQRQQALVLSQALQQAGEIIGEGERDPAKVIAGMQAKIESAPEARIDYIEIYRAEDLEDIKQIEGKVLIALAVKFGNTRLIDNLLVEV
ncbi:MAG: pantoate--beta-alanine ligase [Deltaproteobacteria bacterium]